MTKRKLSEKLGLTPNSLGVILSDSMINKFSFNYGVLVNAMLKVGLTPNELLVE